MSKPPVFPEQSVAGIAVDPRTLERVIPETRRPDGSVRKAQKVRPGFTPQEDVTRFRGTRQQQQDRTALPKGHILGWVAPSSAQTKPKPTVPAAASSGGSGSGVSTAGKEPMTKAAAKNAKRRLKRQEQRQVKDSWEDDDDDGKVESSAGTGTQSLDVQEVANSPSTTNAPAEASEEKVAVGGVDEAGQGFSGGRDNEQHEINHKEENGDDGAEVLADELEKLDVR